VRRISLPIYNIIDRCHQPYNSQLPKTLRNYENGDYTKAFTGTLQLI
jgi:hypothetical protein